MFAKGQGGDPFVSAVNITNFDRIVVLRDSDGGGYKLSGHNVPLRDMGSYTDIATFNSEQQATID